MQTTLEGFSSVLTPSTEPQEAPSSSDGAMVDGQLDGADDAAGEASRRTSNGAVPLVILAAFQENGPWLCDTGSSVEDLRREFDGQVPPGAPPLDWSDLTDGWNKNEGFFDPAEPQLMERGKWCRQWLRRQPYELVVAVTHHGILRGITRTPRGQVRCLSLLYHYQGMTFCSQLNWGNAEFREFRFESEDDEDAVLECISRTVT